MVLDIRIQCSVLAEIKLVAVVVAIGSAGMAEFSATSDDKLAVACTLQCDGPVNGS